MPLPPSDLLLFPTHTHTPTHLHIHFLPWLSFRTHIFEPNLVSEREVILHLLHPPKILIMQAAVSPLRWGPPGDSSTASDWGCATQPDSSAHGAEEKNANGSNQMKAEMRAWSVEERRRGGGGRCEALLIGCHSDSGPVCVIGPICCACLSGWEALAAQDCPPSYWHVFPPKCLEVYEMKRRSERGRHQ